MPRGMPRILFVSGFSSHTRAKDLAYEFEKYGPLVRCDVPATRNPNANPYAFVEFRYERDAEDAYYDMHGARIDDRRITVQWAKNPPSAIWRLDDRPRRDRSPPRRRDDDRDRDRRRSRSPPRRRDDDRDRDRDRRDRDRDDDRRDRDRDERDRDRDRDRDDRRDRDRDDRRDRDRDDRKDREKEPNGDSRRDGKEADKKPNGEVKEESAKPDIRDNAMTPPYDN
ncbi:RNA-binding domain-containing protein [Dacryopinax primogenitus]|uniref:RNA-binding domain-containing protein n=1 Tax=Dacryopinax primogenitus (strain DJM 731) TaxID=1858805 RepID=M5FX09_DACPD|nr:RNA-binding domain-containing protein [Dacryopinax primogenitus]EJU00235.1 RNA-binding domain-containing protein [Dacryopinax primogenitus]